MKTTAFLICFAVSVFGQSAPERSVIVCMQPYGHTLLARSVASKIFAEIGVKLEWRMELRGCPDGSPQITFSTFTPETLKPGALAYATPFADSAIVVFYDRVTQQMPHDKRLVPILLGHVLAHELGHVFQRMDHHSATGVMKARWRGMDFSDMSSPRLSFEKIDTILIYEGIDARARGRLAIASVK